MIRSLLVIAAVIVFFLVLGALRLGWRHRAQRQSALPELPAVPADLGEPLVVPMSGVYVGTTYATSWQDRVVHAGLGRRAATTVNFYGRGVLIDRDGDEPVFLPADALEGARLEPALAGKVVGEGGLLVLRWRLGAAELDSGVRADDKTAYPDAVNAVNSISHPHHEQV